MGIDDLTGSSGEGDSLVFTAQNYPQFQIHTGFILIVAPCISSSYLISIPTDAHI